MIVTIDGPAGSGKSTVARKLAARLGIAYLDTGAMYRAVAHAALYRNLSLNDENALITLVRGVDLEIDCGPTYSRIRVDGHDVSEVIRSLDVSAATPKVAASQAIRDELIGQQRRLGEKLGSFVTEGRDQGSVVFPNADAKFVLEASEAKRADRRFHELLADGQEVTLAQVTANLRARDAQDVRQWESLIAKGDVVVIDTTSLTIPQVIDRLLELLPGTATSGP